MKEWGVVFSFLVLLNACTNNTDAPTVQPSMPPCNLADFDWILGSWTLLTEEKQLIETWTKVNDTLYTGVSMMLQGNDTLSVENIQLEKQNNAIYYTPTVPNQNKGQPITFKLIKQTPNAFIVENPQHEFPQRIIYKHPNPDSLHARIEGTLKGEVRSAEFKMERLE